MPHFSFKLISTVVFYDFAPFCPEFHFSKGDTLAFSESERYFVLN